MTTEIARNHLRFRSPQRPHEIQAWLERELSAAMNPIPGEARTTFQTSYSWAGFQFEIRLVYEAAGKNEDAYSCHMACHSQSNPQDLPALQRTANSWFSLWSRDWRPEPMFSLAPSDDALYQTRSSEWLRIHESLQDPRQIQSRILEAMRQGASFGTAHKEGGTHIYFKDNRWFRSDYGESNAYEIFHTPETFLAFLRQFYDYETSRNLWPSKAPDSTAWRLIYRYLRPAQAS